MGKTFAEKLLAKKAGLRDAVPGQIVTVKPDHLLTHDNTAAIVGKIKDDLGTHGVCRKDLPIIVLDHVIPAADEKTATNHKVIREFVAKHGIENFFDVGRGVCHQVVVEKGFARPGSLIVGSDSHTCSYGAVGAFSTGIDRTEAAALMLVGETWLKVPRSIRITLKGALKPPVSAKDLVLSIIGDLRADGATYCAVEYHGDVKGLTIGDRFTISNMAIEMGAKIGVFPVDAVTEQYLRSIGVKESSWEAVRADKDAVYENELTYDLGRIEPVIACPHKVDNVKPVSELKGLRMNQFLLGTCTNGRLEDLKVAAKILKGRTIAAGTRLLVLPASQQVFEEAMKDGTMAAIVGAGGVVLPPGCGPCLGAHQGALAPGEKCLSTANRNFKGRMGCKEAEIYLGSPAAVAAGALKGEIVDPREV
ncbi:MAG: 3-isopropylmalate dehydratase large subunit [Planctomycetota bacterium]|jgi:homoaconitate hydratase family protein